MSALKETLIQRGLEKSQARYDLHKALVLLGKVRESVHPSNWERSNLRHVLGIDSDQLDEIISNGEKALNSL